ncbi:MAG: hypothetical protein SangKO_077500 [Sandaracinaceae bacterium]
MEDTPNDWRLKYQGTWDARLGAITSSTDPNSLSTSVTYDGLGRLTSVTPPTSQPSCTDPTTRIQYELTSSPASQPISRVVSTTELNCDGTLGEEGQSLVSIGFVDGLGRARSSLATGDSASEWIRGGITTFDKKGTVRRTYQPDVFSGSPTDYRAARRAAARRPLRRHPLRRVRPGEGGDHRRRRRNLDQLPSLSTDVCDPLDNDPSSPHYRTCTTAYTDGHGRVIDQILRNRNPDTGASEVYRLWSYYRPDGAVEALVRANSSSGVSRPADPPPTSSTSEVVRTFVYDSVGRRLSSDDPDSDNGADPTEATNSWRYLFNQVGDLVAVRDPRGCGQNFFYDLGGRLRGEQYVSCAEAQPAAAEHPHGDNSVGHLTAMTYSSAPVTLDVVYHYDTYPSWSSGLIPASASGTQGLATGVSDRAQRAVLAYDDRGNVTWTARQLALISAPIGLNTITVVDGRPVQTEQTVSAGTLEYDVAHTYTRTTEFDHANRPTSMTLPLDPDYHATETAPLVSGSLTYNRRGLPASATRERRRLEPHRRRVDRVPAGWARQLHHLRRRPDGDAHADHEHHDVRRAPPPGPHAHHPRHDGHGRRGPGARGGHDRGRPGARLGRGQQPHRHRRPPRRCRVAGRLPAADHVHQPRRALPRGRRRLRVHAG